MSQRHQPAWPTLPAAAFAWSLAATAALAAAPAPPGGEGHQPIDDFAYGEAEARKLWEPMAGSAAVSVGEVAGKRALRLPCRFQGARIERASWDRKVRLDMTSCRGVSFLLRCPDAGPISSFSLYLRSGGGWYRGGFHAPGGEGWVRVKVAKSEMGVEGEPAGWGAVDCIRLSAWRSGTADTEFQIAELGLYGGGGKVVLVRGEAAAAKYPQEGRGILQYADGAASLLDRTGVPYAVLSDRDVTAGRLKDRTLVILPFNPYLPEEAAKALAGFLRGGGRLLAAYSLPGELREVCGIRPGRHIPQQRSGQFAEIRPAEAAPAGMPSSVRQASWNILDAQVAEGRGGVIAWWYDDDGKSTGKPAAIATDNAVFVTHVLLGDDPANKQRLLLAMMGRLWPEAWRQAAEAQLQLVGRFEPYDGYGSAEAGIRRQAAGERRALDALTAAAKSRDAGQGLLKEGKPVEAVTAAAEAARALLEAHYQAQEPQAGEWRGIWCHSAFGVEGMTWDQAAATLAANGFTAVVPNMLWGGVAYYPSEVLPVAPDIKERGDQIALCLAACRKHGIQCHIWKVNYNMGWRVPKDFAARMKAAGRIQVRPDGSPNDGWLCPSHPDNQKLEVDSMVEVARKYEVDGIHFDYIRYPGPEGCYCGGCRERFEKTAGGKVGRWPADVGLGGELREAWLDFRRAQITAVVSAVAEQARKARPGVKISAAVFRDWPADRDNVGQDWKLWCDRGWVDFICPMDYTPDSRFFEAMVARQLPWAGKVPCRPGIGVSTWADPTDAAKVISQIHVARRLGTGGFMIFNYDPAVARDVLPALGKGITRKGPAGGGTGVPPVSSTAVPAVGDLVGVSLAAQLRIAECGLRIGRASGEPLDSPCASAEPEAQLRAGPRRGQRILPGASAPGADPLFSPPPRRGGSEACQADKIIPLCDAQGRLTASSSTTDNVVEPGKGRAMSDAPAQRDPDMGETPMTHTGGTPVPPPVPPPPLPKPGMDVTAAPKWWLTKPAEIAAFLRSLKGVEVEEIGRTAGGRPILAAAWGPREDLPGRTSRSLTSAISGYDRSAFYGKGQRQRQSVLLVGAAHGTEIEGTVAALSYLNILVTGRDLTGRDQPAIAEAGRKHRFSIIPILNVDGRERYLDHCHWIGCDEEYFSLITQGRWKDGKILHWPEGKVHWPMPLERLSHLGSYYNDGGYNLVYDGPFAGDCQPETTALIRYCRREMPDLVILSHSNNGSLVEAPASYIPAHYRQRSDQIAAVVGMRCHKAGFAKSEIPRRPASYAGDIFYQGDAIHHACGALPVLIEFPQGWKGLPATHQAILDIGLAVLDEVAIFGARYRFRPPDPK